MGRPTRAERFKLSRFKNPGGTYAWRVSGTDLYGRRYRQNYAAREEAVERKAELEKIGSDGGPPRTLRRTSLTDAQLADAEAAFEAIGNRSLGTIVNRFLHIEESAHSKGVSLAEMSGFFTAHFRHEVEPLSIMNAYERFMASRRESGVYPRTVGNYAHSLRLLLRHDPNRPVHEVRVTDLEALLARFKNPNSRRSHRRSLSTFFEWAVRHHHCLENPCKRLDKLVADDRPVSVLSLKEVQRLLKAAQLWKNGAMVPVIAIALFAGLRPSEIQALKPEDVRSTGIRVSGGKLRRKTSRMVPIPPILKIWLKVYPFEGLPNHWVKSYRVLRKATKAKSWVQDVLRHTSVTFQLGRDKNEALTCFNTGTSLQMLNRHYRQTIEREDEVKNFWNLSPDSLESVKLKLPDAPAGAKRVQWPSDNRLRQMIATLPMTRVGEQLGCSDNAVRKRCAKRGIAIPGKPSSSP